ncbi:hypothetical protein AC1031_007522 [Aphanomyces cochlioides]|nr:hypothetical protein AC1031_007522 [Aphanomyces cochlioides]
MISMTVFLIFMDVKDLYYKIFMCGVYPSFSFILQTPETVTDYDMVKAIRDANGTWLSPTNMWNALALECDAFYPSTFPPGKPAHLSSFGINCTLGGVKYYDKRMFVGSHRLDTFMWATGMLGDIVDEPLAAPPYSNGLACCYDFENKADIPVIKADVRNVTSTFGSRTSLWGTALCYEAMHLPAQGTKMDLVAPVEHGCIWRDMETNNTVKFHIGETTGKYYRALCDMMGLQWHTMDYLSAGSGVFLRAKMYMKSFYNIEHTAQGEIRFQHDITTNFGFDGVLYFLLIGIEIIILYINATDSAIVAMNVVRPILGWAKSSSYTMNSTATTATSVRDLNKASNTKKDEEKANTLSKMLLYTDLTSIAYRKPLLTALVVLDTLLAWLYIVPNSNIFAWGSSTYQLGSAYLSMFRVWVLVLVIIDRAWRWKVAALITEFTYLTSFEIMCSTLIGVALSFDEIMNICVMKYGLADGQRALSPSTPTVMGLYNVYTRYSWGDRSNEKEALSFIYYPLAKIISYGVLFSFVVLVVRAIATVSWRYRKGKLLNEVENFWRSYHRNSVEVFMNNPLRANALIRSQSMMSYKFGTLVFIRPFVYLEQNYYITREKFRMRPDIPFLHNEDANNGADVDTQSYNLKGVFRDENSNKLKKRMAGHDVQIPLS